MIRGQLQDRLKSVQPELDLIFLPEIPSTNTYALDLLHQGRAAPFLVVAAQQSAGRGRLGRAWESGNRKGIWASLALSGMNPENAFEAIQAMSVALSLALKSASNHRVEIKWPNDVLMEKRKIAGILAEASGVENGFVIGFGVNVNQSSTDFPEDLSGIATSLHRVTGRTYDLEEILINIILLFFHWHNHPDLAQRYRELCGTLGRACLIDGRKFQAKSIAADGALIVVNENGKEEAIYSGTLRYE